MAEDEKAPGTLLEAILAVQGEVGTLPKDAVNPAFQKGGKGGRYTPLDTIVEVVGPILNKNGLVWMTFPEQNDAGQPVLSYALIHAATGVERGGTMPLLNTKNDPQGMGSAITYARRYSLCAVLNLVADDDDDGAAGSGGAKPADLARAKDRMTPAAKKLYAQAQAIGSWVPEEQFQKNLERTGYTEEGLQRYVTWLENNAPKEEAPDA